MAPAPGLVLVVGIDRTFGQRPISCLGLGSCGYELQRQSLLGRPGRRLPIPLQCAPDRRSAPDCLVLFCEIRIVTFFDRSPGALKGIPFCLDVTSDECRGLWPQRYERWSAELEVFHNPFARHPVPFAPLPGATHWFDLEGERVCRSVYATSILWSPTLI
jgi:hypothetical protein